MRWGSKSYVIFGARSRHFFKRRTLYIALTLIIIPVLIVLLLLGPSYISIGSGKTSFPLNILGDQVCEPWETKRITNIPNIVHYIWILTDRKTLQLDFKFFIAVYSAQLYFQPDTIYFHTDALPNVFNHAKSSGDEWTKRVLSLSTIKYHYVEVPAKTTKGVPIELQEHKYEFIRMKALQEIGGICLDTNAIPLRDVIDLRNSGFANIVSGTLAGPINNEVMLAAPRSALMEIYSKAFQEFFDGTSTLHLLTDIATRLSAIPHEALILHPQAFGPAINQVQLYNHHLETSAGLDVMDYAAGRNMTSCKDMLGWLLEKERFGGDEWDVDFSGSYVLRVGGGDGEVDKIHGLDWRVDLNDVLARQSVFARAVYPAVAHAIIEGIIPPF